MSYQFLTIPSSVGQLNSSSDRYLEASSPTMISFNWTSSPKIYSDLSIGLPTREAKDALGKLSPENPIFIQPVPGSQITVSPPWFIAMDINKIADIMDPSQEQQVHQPHTDPLTQLNAALSLAKSMPPSKLKKNLIGLISLAPEIEDNLLQKIELPMEIDNSNPDRPFLKTQFNRDGDSYRSPFTNQYDPPSEDGYRPSGPYRALEETGSVLFTEYIKLYYGDPSVGSFYVLENEEGNGNFSCGFFAKKIADDSEGFRGAWDSFNVVDVQMNGNICDYKLHTTILIEMDIGHNGINLTGFLKKDKEEKRQFAPNATQEEIFQNHLATIGEMIQDQESTMRQHLEAIYVSKTKEIVFTTRWENTVGMEQQRMGIASDLKKLRFGS